MGKMTYKDYYKFLKKEKPSLDEKIKQIDSKLSYLLLCCDVVNGVALNNPNKIIALLNEDSKEKFKNVLKVIFKSDSLKGREKALDTLLKKAYGNNGGYIFKRPNNLDEFVDFVKNCVMIITINQNNSCGDILDVFNTLQILIVRSANALLQEKHNIEIISNGYSKLIKAFDGDKMIEIEESKLDSIKNILNNINSEFATIISENYDSKEQKTDKVGLGDTFEFVVKTYNKKYEFRLVNKIDEKIKQYYKRIQSIPFEQLKQQNLPKYSNVNFLQIMKELIIRFEPEVKLYKQDDEEEKTTLKQQQEIELYTFLQMHYLGYFLKGQHDKGNAKKK